MKENLLATKFLFYGSMVMVWVVAFCCAGFALLAHDFDLDRVFYITLGTLLFIALGSSLSVILHRRQYRPAGIVLLTVFVTAWAIAIGAFCIPGWLNDNGWSAVTVLLMIGIPTGVSMTVVTRPWGKWFAWVMFGIGSLCVVAALLGFSLRPSQAASGLMLIALYTYVYFGVGVVSLVNVGCGDRRYFRWLGVLLGAAAAAEMGVWYWKETHGGGEDWRVNVATMAFIGSATLGCVNLILMTWKPGLVRIMQIAAICLAIFTGLALIGHQTMLMWEMDRWRTQAAARAAVMGLSLGAAAIVCMLVARTMLRLAPRRSLSVPVHRMEITCPVCGLRQEMGMQGSCRGCLLKFRISLAETHCPGCDHVLLRLTSDRCPECGCNVPRPA